MFLNKYECKILLQHAFDEATPVVDVDFINEIVNSFTEKNQSLVYCRVTDHTYNEIGNLLSLAKQSVYDRYMTCLRKIRYAYEYRQVIDTSDIKFGTNICDLNLSTRVVYALGRANLSTVGDVVIMSPKELLKLRSFGEVALSELITELKKHGYSLWNASGAYAEWSISNNVTVSISPANAVGIRQICLDRHAAVEGITDIPCNTCQYRAHDGVGCMFSRKPIDWPVEEK